MSIGQPKMGEYKNYMTVLMYWDYMASPITMFVNVLENVD